MPKASKIVYPPGVKEINEDLTTDDLVRRLKECAQAFQNMNQDDDNSRYVPLAILLATENYMEHSSKDVRLLIACCIADVFRVFAPEAPYKDPEHLKNIFEFFIQQLRGLEDPKDATFKRYFYLLENLAWVKSFNICIELEENQSIFYKLFALIFGIVNDNHSPKVKNFMLDMMCPLISEADVVSQELLDIILIQIIEPRKSQNKNAYALSKEILKKTGPILEPYIQAFFNNALILGKTAQSDVVRHLYDLIYELNSICPTTLAAVLPQLEFKLKSNDEKERLAVTRLLARMFSDKNSDLAEENKTLWTCFLGRFNDISVQVRMRCVQYAMHFLINHPELRPDITEQLRQRQHDPEENVRYEAVMAIISAAKRDFDSVTDELLTFVKERTLDKRFKIRKEALQGLAFLYKQHMSSSTIAESTMDCISWIKNKVLHVYYQTALDDRLLVERILNTCLVPYQLPLVERVKKLYQLFASVDDFAVKAFNELLKCQNMVRTQFKQVMECLTQPKSEERKKNLTNRIIILAKNLPEPVKTQEYIRKFCNMLENNARLRNHIDTVLSGKSSCIEAELSVKEVLKSLGFPVQTNSFYTTIKSLLERVAPAFIDHSGVIQILGYVKDSLVGEGAIDLQIGVASSAYRGLQLLYTMSFVFSYSFRGEDIYDDLLTFLNCKQPRVAELTLQILANIGADVENEHPAVAARLFPFLKNFVENGTVKEAKHAVICLNALSSNKERVFGQILDHLKQHLTLQSTYFQTSLVSIGHIAFLCPELFGPTVKNIVSKVVVKELLMVDQEPGRQDSTLWVPFDELPEETKVKCEGMKMMVRWLVGLHSAANSATSSMKLLNAVILHQGDLMEKGISCPAEKSWLRYTAAASMLKLCQEPAYSDIIKHDQFQVLALVINDECYQVREKFALKLHKGLIAMKLPLEFMAVFSLGGLEKMRELKSQFKHYLLSNINKRREYLKQHPVLQNKLLQILPDYVMPYAIHLLAHDLHFKQPDDVASLTRISDCLWFLMEPLIIKNENYSFSFFKRLIENIKQCKDKQAPDDELANKKMYAVCDLALRLVLSKTTNFLLKEFPAEAKLPAKLFTDPDYTHSNTKIYLPSEMQIVLPKKSCLEHGGMAGSGSRSNQRSSLRQRNTLDFTNNGNNYDMDAEDLDMEDGPPSQSVSFDNLPRPAGKRPRGRPRKVLQTSGLSLDHSIDSQAVLVLPTESLQKDNEQSLMEEDLQAVEAISQEETIAAQEGFRPLKRPSQVEEDEEEEQQRVPASTSKEPGPSSPKRTRLSSESVPAQPNATKESPAKETDKNANRAATKGANVKTALTETAKEKEQSQPAAETQQATRQSARISRSSNGSESESSSAARKEVAEKPVPVVEERRVLTRRR